MKILVTGSKGQLGSELHKLVDAQNTAEHTFYFHDIDTLDLLNESALEKTFDELQPDMVVNCAAYTAVDKAEEDRENANKGNVILVENLVTRCKSANCYFIHISTDYVFDGTNHLPYTETDKINPIGYYGETKRKGEEAALGYTKTIVIRTSWLYSTFGGNFVKTMIRLGRERDELGVIYDQIGTPTYASDLASAILSIIAATQNDFDHFKPGIYHFSNEGAISWYDFAKAIMEIKEISCTVKPIESSEYPTPVKRPHYSVLNKKKIKSTYGLAIPYWRESLIRCLSQLD